jgi:hypothetical protein
MLFLDIFNISLLGFIFKERKLFLKTSYMPKLRFGEGKRIYNLSQKVPQHIIYSISNKCNIIFGDSTIRHNFFVEQFGEAIKLNCNFYIHST